MTLVTYVALRDIRPSCKKNPKIILSPDLLINHKVSSGTANQLALTPSPEARLERGKILIFFTSFLVSLRRRCEGGLVLGNKAQRKNGLRILLTHNGLTPLGATEVKVLAKSHSFPLCPSLQRYHTSFHLEAPWRKNGSRH